MVDDSRPNGWWQDRPLRVLHPNMREREALDLDVKGFIDDCQSMGAEAIVFSSGGIYAFYDTDIEGHHQSEACADRDLLQEVVERAHATDLRVIARLDFSNAPRAWFEEHPSWFHRLPGEVPVDPGSRDRFDRYYDTNVLGGYQNEDFALPVLHEIISTYEIDGIHLNASGWRANEFSNEMVEEHEIPSDGLARRAWKERTFAAQLDRYRTVIHGDADPSALFMGETNSIDSPRWGLTRGYNPETMADGFTNILSTAGEPSIDQRYRFRWWVALTADWLHAAEASGLPLINLKTTGGYGDKHTLKPVAEFQFYAYQAMAHNAGIKAAMYAIPATHPDPRANGMIAEPFTFMADQEAYMTGVERIAPIGLVWPSTNLTTDDHDPARIVDEIRTGLFGIYRSLLRRHLLSEIVLSDRLEERLNEYDTLIIPHVGCLRNTAADVLGGYVDDGGTLVILDHQASNRFEPTPPALVELTAGSFDTSAFEPAYAISAEAHPAANRIGPLTLGTPVRHHEPPENAQQWLRDSPTPGGAYIPEEHVTVESGDRSVAYVIHQGDGRVAYVGCGLGALLWRDDLPAVETLLEHLVVPAGGRFLSPDLPPTVDVTAFRTEDAVVLHLVNGTGRVPLDSAITLSELPVTVMLDADGPVTRYAPGSEPTAIVPTTHEGALTIEIPDVGPYAQLVIEGASGTD